MNDIYRKGVGTDFAKKIGMFVHHEIRNFSFLEPFSDEASEKEKEEPGKKRKIIRGAETRSGKADNRKIFAELEIVGNSDFSEHYRSGRKTVKEKIGQKGNHRAEKSRGLFNGFSENVINYH